ncbi:MAG: hypothetical protein JWP53_3083, partial [Conexibacter sp.]|nr:hypothetical protein [Conexibacter sp.]
MNVRPQLRCSSSVAVAGALVAGGLSLLVAHPLGYDAWSWMVWARELAHGALET